ncbi:MAG: hypothetical protein IT323_13780 [Anaerolineae bacterium]|nr:hypothetical protein [Anaerolineae bacterium]
MMNEQTQKALDWMREVVGQAFTEAQNGDTTLLNKLGFYPSMQYYVNNVHGRSEATFAQWLHWHPQHLREVVALYEVYQREQEVAAATERVGTLEAKLNDLTEQLKALLEAQTPAEKPAPKKRGRPRKVAEAEAVAEEEPDEDDAEQGQEEPEASADQAEEPEAES